MFSNTLNWARSFVSTKPAPAGETLSLVKDSGHHAAEAAKDIGYAIYGGLKMCTYASVFLVKAAVWDGILFSMNKENAHLIKNAAIGMKELVENTAKAVYHIGAAIGEVAIAATDLTLSAGEGVISSTEKAIHDLTSYDFTSSNDWDLPEDSLVFDNTATYSCQVAGESLHTTESTDTSAI